MSDDMPLSDDGAVVPGLISHLSPSAINMYLRCPRQYEYRYVKGEKVPPDGGLVAGIAFHNAAETALIAKRDEDRVATEEEVADLARDEAQTGLEDAVLEEGQTAGAIKDKAARLSEGWARDLLPDQRPAEVEASWETVIDDVKVVGRIDMIDTDGVVKDWKTSSKSPPNPQALAANPQTGLYALASESDNVHYAYIVDNKSGVKCTEVALPTDLTASARELASELVVDVATAVRSGVFPRNQSGWWCSPRWCGYYSQCVGKVRKKHG